jgi:para-nitrobenzyl esterase
VLNVLTPSVKQKRPVMVYMHGGGYNAGSGIIGLGADRLVKEQDVVLVTVNHRLAALGYLYLATSIRNTPTLAMSGTWTCLPH